MPRVSTTPAANAVRNLAGSVSRFLSSIVCSCSPRSMSGALRVIPRLPTLDQNTPHRNTSRPRSDRPRVRRMARMHVDELEIDEPLVRRLLVEQFPKWADRPLARALPAGTENAIFRLGDDLAVRLARRKGRSDPGGKELEWLPRLAPLLPLEIPVPVAQGRPSADY